MNKIYKICLFLAIFIATSSVTWAGLNYDSAHNYFLIDSLLKPGGNYFLIGDAFDEIPDSFAVSNNLIFFKQGGLFKSSDNVRQMSLDNTTGKSFLTTNAITVKAANNDFEIISPSGSLNIKGNKINMNKDFIITEGLTFVADQQPGDYNIYVDTVLTDSIELFDNTSPLIIKEGKEIDLAARSTAEATAIGGTASAESIILDGEDFCTIQTWQVDDDVANATANKSIPDSTNTKSCLTDAPDGGDLGGSDVGGIYAQKTCCPQNYYVFDLDATEGRMVCCRVNN